MITLQNVHKSYTTGQNRLHVLKGIDLQINDGEMVAIMGSSGSGKSTLLNILGILDEYDEGAYYLDGTLMKNLTAKKSAHYRNRFIGFVFQSFNLLPFKNAWENVALPLYYQKVPRKEREQRARELLRQVGIEEWATHTPGQLSGGQKQRVAIARALAASPKLILADEPTGALDSRTSQDVMQLFHQVNQMGKTVLIVTHERDIAQQCPRIIRVKDGIITNRDYVD